MDTITDMIMGVDHAKGESVTTAVAGIYHDDGTLEIIGMKEIDTDANVEDFSFSMSRKVRK